MVSIISTPGSSGWPGKWPSNTGLASGTGSRRARSVPPDRAALIRSTIWKYSSRIRDQAVFAATSASMLAAQVLQHEVLVGGDLALVDVLRPLLQRHLDAERLVDGEGDVEEIQAVDAQIVDRVTVRRDLLTRNVTGLGNDPGDRLKRGRHRPKPHRTSGRALTPAPRCRKSRPGRSGLRPGPHQALPPWTPHQRQRPLDSMTGSVGRGRAWARRRAPSGALRRAQAPPPPHSSEGFALWSRP